ncbi:MAG: hypothetical protein VX367_08465 [SAR324 cluster bacterium]|nr:hypothetical protein [SAR324 cluster bacterium]
MKMDFVFALNLNMKQIPGIKHRIEAHKDAASATANVASAISTAFRCLHRL